MILSSKTNCLNWRLSVGKLPMTSRIIKRLGKNRKVAQSIGVSHSRGAVGGSKCENST
jgi:hypothetical protein